jgi:hypothetical protein
MSTDSVSTKSQKKKKKRKGKGKKCILVRFEKKWGFAAHTRMWQAHCLMRKSTRNIMIRGAVRDSCGDGCCGGCGAVETVVTVVVVVV